MESSDATAERERRLVCGHPVPSFLRRKRATLASPFAGCRRCFGRLIERDVRVRLRDRHAPMSTFGGILRPGRIRELAGPFRRLCGWKRLGAKPAPGPDWPTRKS